MPIKRKEVEELNKRHKEAMEELTRNVTRFLMANSEDMFTSLEITETVVFPEFFKEFSIEERGWILAEPIGSLLAVKTIEVMKTKNNTYFGIKK